MAELYYFSKLKADLKLNSFADNEKVKLQTSTSMRHDKKFLSFLHRGLYREKYVTTLPNIAISDTE